jgi:eukaryotic-like serine/threonine-protein kinase
MKPELWARVKRITADALELPDAERPESVARACAGDQALRREVESLLEAHARAGDFIQGPALAGSGAQAVAAALQRASPLAAGRTIGPYRVIRELGSGGMGVVYLADRADAAFEKQVAVKVVRSGFASESLARLVEERRILATLEHPNIARLLDGGNTEDGMPYIVMEYVDGIPLDAYCEERMLSVAQRLRLFYQVCAAVQYAHQRLIIHRDLKAHNILVTADATPKLLDFGVARLLDPDLAAEDQTRTAVRALTLAAASPEQVRAEPVTVTSDVYALGVLLFRLLTGQSPYGPRQRSEAELARAICEEAPPRPSAVAPAEQRRALRGDLDWIVLTALRKEPERRYAAVAQLADDVVRHLERRPVAAAPDSWRYRARKLAQRNRTAVAAAALLVISLLGGMAATLRQARRTEEQKARAERRFNDVRQLANSVLFEIHDAIKDLPGSTAARALVVKRGAEYLDGLSREAQGDLALQREMAAAYQKIGDVQGEFTYGNLGDTAGARVSYEKALALQQAILAADPAQHDARYDLAVTYQKLGRLLYVVRDWPAAARAHETVLATVGPAEVASARELLLVSRAHSSLAWVLSHSSGEATRAREHADKALALAERLAARDPEDRTAQEQVVVGIERVGTVMERTAPGTGAGVANFRRARAAWDRMLLSQPHNASLQRSLLANRSLEGEALLDSGRPAGARDAYRQALVLAEAISGADPTNMEYRADLASVLARLGSIELQTDDGAAAVAHLRHGVTLLESIIAANPAHAQNRANLALAYAHLGEAHVRTAGARSRDRVGHWQSACSNFRSAAQAVQALPNRDAFDAPDAAFLAAVPARIRECDAGGRRQATR